MLLLTLAVLHTTLAVPPPPRIAVKAAALIDPRSGARVTDAVVIVDGETVTAVGSRLAVPPGSMVIDLGAATLVPGLIDAHTHITSQPGDNYYEDLFRRGAADVAVLAHLYARRTLEAGFTTVRDVGATAYIDVALKRAIDKGLIRGPRMQVATTAVGATGGHNDLVGFAPEVTVALPSGVADGPDAIRRLVRTQIKHGADLIKLVATAGVLSEEESVGAPQYSEEEMRAAVEEAHQWGKKVAAHAHGTEGIKRAIRAGVTSVEHASFLDDEAIRLARERGTFLVMDIYNDDWILAEFAKKGYPEKIIDKERAVGRTQRESFRKALRAGCRMAFGTDAGVFPHGLNARQFTTMVAWGMTPLQALQAATVTAAELLGWQDRVGVVAKGAFADLVAVRGDPLKDVATLERPCFVMKGGVVAVPSSCQ